jgi:Protein of unknown function (DUF2934)
VASSLPSSRGATPNANSRGITGDASNMKVVAERFIMTSAHRVVLLRELTRRVAYQLWVERGRPFGSPEVDWFHAEVLLDQLGSIWVLEGF